MEKPLLKPHGKQSKQPAALNIITATVQFKQGRIVFPQIEKEKPARQNLAKIPPRTQISLLSDKANNNKYLLKHWFSDKKITEHMILLIQKTVEVAAELIFQAFP